jgi:hypothetical protein
MRVVDLTADRSGLVETGVVTTDGLKMRVVDLAVDGFATETVLLLAAVVGFVVGLAAERPGVITTGSLRVRRLGPEALLRLELLIVVTVEAEREGRLDELCTLRLKEEARLFDVDRRAFAVLTDRTVRLTGLEGIVRAGAERMEEAERGCHFRVLLGGVYEGLALDLCEACRDGAGLGGVLGEGRLLD